MLLTTRLDAYQRAHRRAGYPIAVLYKFLDDGGGHLAALITYYAFVSLFPLLLLASTLLSVVLRGDPAAQHAVLSSALAQFPVIGRQLGQPRQLSGGTAGVVIGALGALYGGLGVAVAGQSAMDTVWAVPRNERPNPFAARARGLLLLAAVGVAVLVTTGLSALTAGAGAFGLGARLLTLLASAAVNVGAFVLAFRLSTRRELSVADVLPGAIAAAAVWQALQITGKAFVTHTIKHASATNSLFAIVLGSLALLHVTSVVVLLCAEANAVRVDRLHPRSLLGPVTDEAVLTPADERSYAALATSQRSKAFELIRVSFHRPRRDS